MVSPLALRFREERQHGQCNGGSGTPRYGRIPGLRFDSGCDRARNPGAILDPLLNTRTDSRIQIDNSCCTSAVDDQQISIIKAWEKFLDPQKLRRSLIEASVFIAAYEVLKAEIVERTKSFLNLGREDEPESRADLEW
jgi:hypothetical protein